MSKTLTPEQYQQQFVDYYSFPGIGVEAAPEVDDEEKDDEPVRPNILTPVGQRDEQVANVFGQIPIVGTGQQISTEDPYEYIRNFDTQEKSDLNGKGFSRYLEQAAGVPGTVATVATGLPISALAYGAGQLARKQHRKNAESIASYGGNAGSMFKFQGQTVSRAPGSKIFTGNLGGLSQSDMYRTDEIRKGFIPGTMIENTSIRRGAGPQGMPGSSGLSGVTSIEGAIMDAFGTVHTGQRDDSGHMMVSASQAQALREKEFRSMARQAEVDISGLKGVNFVNAAVAYKQHVDGVMKTDSSYGGFFHKTSNLSPGQNASALDRRRGTAVDFLKDKYGITPTTKVDTSQPDDFVPSVTESRSEANRIREAERDAAFERGQAARDRMMDRLRDEGDPQETSPTEYSMSDFADDYAASYEGVTDFGFRRGGRVGMAEGDTPQGTFEPGFVEGPPENFTERETVADDQNGKVTPDTFIINAAAVEIAGSEDIRKMLMKAYEVAVQKGLDIGRVDRKLYEGTVDVALSKGEVVVPPELAKIIGYDRLRKINNRGKKEVASRQKKAGGGFLDGKKFADGGDVGEDIPFDQSIPIDDSTRKVFKTFLKSKRQRGDVENLIDSLDDRGRLFVLGLVETTASTDSVESMTGVMQTAVNRANTNRPSFKNVNDLASVMKQRSSRGTGSRMFQYDGLEPKKITPRLREVVQGRVPNAVSKLFTAAENLMNPETEGQRPLPSDIMFYTKPDAPLAKDFEDNPKMRYFTSFGGHDYYALDAAPEGFVNN
tara:strand:- start:13055 stop:15379 length:2325 start_codon:yes stop_codon:yes gene_type:complete